MKHLLCFFALIIAFSTTAQTAMNALHFDGADDYIDCTLPSSFTNLSNNELTVECWITPTIGTFQRILFAQDDPNNFVSLSLTTAGEVLFYVVQSGNNQSVQSTDVLTSLQLVHLAGTWNPATSEAKIFLNGSEVSYAQGIFASSTGVDNKLTIGSRTDGAQSFSGNIDELSIWNVAKPACEIKFEMQDKRSGNEPNLTTYYNFDAGVAGGNNTGVDQLIDAVAGNNGTLMGFALSGSTSNWIASLVDIYRWWGQESTLLVGQLGLVATINAASYEWVYCPNFAPIPGATNATFDPATEDPNYAGSSTYYALISTDGNCIDTSGCYNEAGLAQLNDLEQKPTIRLYPNPCADVLNIQGEIGIESIEIFTVNGDLHTFVQVNGKQKTTLSLSGESGIYFVKILTEIGTYTERIVLQKH